jgi:hypothetical protein
VIETIATAALPKAAAPAGYAPPGRAAAARTPPLALSARA